MDLSKIKEAINSIECNQLQKNVMNGFIDRAAENNNQRIADRTLIEDVAREKNLSEVIISNEDVKIYKVSGKEDWDINYPYKSIFKETKSGKWIMSGTASPTLDLAFLVYLEKKHLGFNSRFVDFAAKMLEIKLD